MGRFNVLNVAWKDILPFVKPIVPPLTHLEHKGAMGRIGVLGGSVDYTGAPFYAGISSLKFGADLAYIFCAYEASIPIKSYSPELMVTPFYEDSTFTSNDSFRIENEVSRFDPLDDAEIIEISRFLRQLLN